MPITSVNLCPETKKIADNMKNKSAFFRECLKRWHALENNHHVHMMKGGLCYPESKRGLCSICWPNGPPSHEDWMYYREIGERGGDYPVAWIRSKVDGNRTQFELPREWGRKERPGSASTPREKPSIWQKLRLGFKRD